MGIKKTISTDMSPCPVGPYSQAVAANGFIFLSGQIPLTPDGDMVRGALDEQFDAIMSNVSEILNAGGAGIADIIKVTVFLRDIEKFEELNEPYQAYFDEPYPAREVVEVSGLPKRVDLEISVVAVAR